MGPASLDLEIANPADPEQRRKVTLLGAHALEALGFVLYPLSREFWPMRMILWQAALSRRRKWVSA